MKNKDHSFKLLVAIVLAGLITACIPSNEATAEKSPVLTTAPSHASGAAALGAE